MKLTKEIEMAHKQLSDCSVKFLEFVKKNPESLKRSNFSLLEWHDKAIRLQPWPTFINQTKKRELETASIKICNLVKSIPQRMFSNDIAKIGRYYETPVDIVNIQLGATNDDHIHRLLARGDFIFSPSGIKCIEYNVSSDLGGLEKPIWESMYLETEVIARFLKEYNVKIQNKNLLSFLLTYLTDIALQKHPSQIELNIAFAIPGYTEGIDRAREITYLNQTYKDVLQLRDKHLRGQIIFCDYHHLNSADNGVLYEDKKIHILIEIYGGIVLPEILNHFKEGNILVFNGPITRLLSNKLNLALLSENEDSAVFNDEEREAIKKYIPWTRKITPGDTTYDQVKIKLEDFILSNKDKLVIKPSEGYGGIGVSIGQNTPALQWQENVKKAISQKNWLVQEHIESLPYLYQKGQNGYAEQNVVWGGFVFGSEFVGGWVRILPREDSNGVINRAQGAEEGVIFEVEE